MLNNLEQRLTDPRFVAFRNARQCKLIANGEPIFEAMRIASWETRERARASLTHGIDAALDADLIILGSKDPAVEPRIFLVGELPQ